MLNAFHWSRGPRQRLKRAIVKLKYISRDFSFQYLMNISTHHQFRRFISLPRSIKQRNHDKRSSAPFQRVDFPVKLQMNCPRFNKRTEINGKYARFVTENGVFVTVLHCAKCPRISKSKQISSGVVIPNMDCTISYCHASALNALLPSRSYCK